MFEIHASYYVVKDSLARLHVLGRVQLIHTLDGTADSGGQQGIMSWDRATQQADIACLLETDLERDTSPWR
jgi:hypothetical protein